MEIFGDLYFPVFGVLRYTMYVLFNNIGCLYVYTCDPKTSLLL